MAMADGIFGPGPDGIGDVGLSLAHGLFHGCTFGERCGDSRGQRATGTVVVSGRYPFTRQNNGAPFSAKIETVVAVTGFQMTAFDQDIAAAQGSQINGRLLDGRGGGNCATEQNRGLGEIGVIR